MGEEEWKGHCTENLRRSVGQNRHTGKEHQRVVQERRKSTERRRTEWERSHSGSEAPNYRQDTTGQRERFRGDDRDEDTEGPPFFESIYEIATGFQRRCRGEWNSLSSWNIVTRQQIRPEPWFIISIRKHIIVTIDETTFFQQEAFCSHSFIFTISMYPSRIPS